MLIAKSLNLIPTKNSDLKVCALACETTLNLKSIADPGVDSGDYENPDVLKLGQWTGPLEEALMTPFIVANRKLQSVLMWKILWV